MSDKTQEQPPEPAQELLEKIFHEPSRLAIMSALCAAERGLPFVALRDACRLSDGNLNRHVKVLEEAQAVVTRKRFLKNKPLTTVKITESGLRRFQEYLAALSQVLEEARRSLPVEQRNDAVAARAVMARA